MVMASLLPAPTTQATLVSNRQQRVAARSVLDAYDNLVRWYDGRKPLTRKIALAVFSAVLLLTLYLTVTHKLTTPSSMPYGEYTPTYWVLTLAAYLPFA